MLEIRYKFTTKELLYHSLGIVYLLELFVKAPINVGSFKVEWPYFISLVLFIGFFASKQTTNNILKKSFLLFSGWCMLLGVISILRFPMSIVYVGLAHTTRMVVMFIPYLWIVCRLNDAERKELYLVLKKYIIISLIILLFLGLHSGGIYNWESFETVGVGKNSLGYTIVCVALLFFTYEKEKLKTFSLKPYIFIVLCIIIAVFTKSGTAVAFILVIALLYVIENLHLSNRSKIIVCAAFCLIGLILLKTDILINFFEKIHIYKLSEFITALQANSGTLGETTDVRLSVQKNVLKDFDLNMAVGRFYYYYFATHGYTAHQLFLQILYDTGVIGLFLFVSFLYYNIKGSNSKTEIVIMLLYSFIEVFLIQYFSLIVLGLLTTRRETNK